MNSNYYNALMSISNLGGNLPLKEIGSCSGPNDGKYKADLLASAIRIARRSLIKEVQ